MILKHEHRHVTAKDFIVLSLIFLIVSISLPVSTMGHQNAFDYFFSQKEVQIIDVDKDCLSINRSCTFALNNNTEMTIQMPEKVSSVESFNISAEFSDKKIDAINILFQGKEHSHGLRKLTMNKINSSNFNLQGQLGYCGSGVMQWTAIFNVFSDQTIYKVSLPFTSIDPKANSKEALEWLNKSKAA